MADSASETDQSTPTLLVYHPLLPSVPVTTLVMTGGVVSPGGGGGSASEQTTISSGCSQPTIVSPFRTLPTMSTLKRSGLSDRPLSVARIATPSELGRYATSAMLFAPNTLLRTSAFCASCRLTPPRTAPGELPCTSLFSIRASPASATSPTCSKRTPARPLLTTRLSCTQKPFRWLSESWQKTSHHRPLPWLSWM